MKPSIHHPSICLAATLAAGFFLITTTARAGHVYAGIIDTNGTPGLQAGDALAFVDTTLNNGITDGTAITGASLGTLSLSIVSAATPQNGLYRASSPTFTALSRGIALDAGAYVTNGNAFAATVGSFLQLQIVSVTGPNGGVFKFWEGASGSEVTQFAYTVGTGLSSGSGIITLTDRTVIVGDGTTALPAGTYTFPGTLPSGFSWNDVDGAGGAAPLDPFGHQHNRSFTTDLPGTYTVSYVIKDSSGQQADSAPFAVSYSTVPEPGTLSVLAGGVAMLALLRNRRRTRA